MIEAYIYLVFGITVLIFKQIGYMDFYDWRVNFYTYVFAFACIMWSMMIFGFRKRT